MKAVDSQCFAPGRRADSLIEWAFVLGSLTIHLHNSLRRGERRMLLLMNDGESVQLWAALSWCTVSTF